jgi:hypothetical protein
MASQAPRQRTPGKPPQPNRVRSIFQSFVIFNLQLCGANVLSVPVSSTAAVCNECRGANSKWWTLFNFEDRSIMVVGLCALQIPAQKSTNKVESPKISTHLYPCRCSEDWNARRATSPPPSSTLPESLRHDRPSDSGVLKYPWPQSMMNPIVLAMALLGALTCGTHARVVVWESSRNQVYQPRKGQMQSEEGQGTSRPVTKAVQSLKPSESLVENVVDEERPDLEVHKNDPSAGLSLLPQAHAPWMPMWTNSVAICSTMKDENITDIIEWLHYYRCAPTTIPGPVDTWQHVSL